MAKAKSGDMVTVDYKGTLEDGKLFDSSEGKKPLQFMIGAGQYLKGFEEGIIEMEEGTEKEEERKDKQQINLLNLMIEKHYEIDFNSCDILQNPELRHGVKIFSNWPTFFLKIYVSDKV